MNKSHPGIKAFYNFIDAFNTVDKDKILNNLHFPHFTHSDGNETIKYEDGEAFWNVLEIQLYEMVHIEKWSFSTLDKCEIINQTKNTIQCHVEFNRRYENKESYGTAKGIWIVTLRDNRWALQIRSMIPVSGNISSLAGTKNN